MTLKLPALIAFVPFLFSCGSEHSSKGVILKVILSKDQRGLLANKYVYYVDVTKNRVVDSALVKEDTLTFSENWTRNFAPHMVAVHRIDTFDGHPYLHPMGLKSPYDAKFIYSSFYIDKGTTVLKPYLTGSNNEQPDFIGSNQNEPFLKHVELQFPPEHALERAAVIEKNISKIRSYPYSIFLLEQLFRYKDKFLSDDLKRQLSFFDDNVKSTALYQSFAEYFSSSSTFDRTFPSIGFESQDGHYQKVGRDGAAYYLVVYWASWCGPCRREIPDIKGLYNKYADKGLAITSISMDGDKHHWQAALIQEKMPWQQLIAVDSTKAFIDLHYDIKAIPKAYLFNQKKVLVKTFDDALVMTNYIHSVFEKVN